MAAACLPVLVHPNQQPPCDSLLPCTSPPHMLPAQTILDACGVIEGLKQFKYLDEKGKDQGINVRPGAAVLGLLPLAPM